MAKICTLKKRQEFLKLQRKISAHKKDEIPLVTNDIIEFKTIFFICKARLRNDNEWEHKSNRLGIVVVKKIGGAVIRNRIKRRLKSLWHDYKPLQQPHQLDLVFIASFRLADGNFQQLQHDFQETINNIYSKIGLTDGK